MENRVHAFQTGPVVGQLLKGSRQDWQNAVNHQFVTELFEGTLADSVLKTYLIQDYHFFDAFLSMLGACVAHADRLEAKLRFAKQLGFLEADEDGYFLKAFKELEVPEKDYLHAKLYPVTKDFQDLMYSAVTSSDYAHLLVMLVIAEGLYLDWGSKDLTLPGRYVHLEWVNLHRGPFFEEWVQFLVDELNRVCKDKEDVTALQERWNHAVALELAFFDLGYDCLS
ncbi:TenA family protein [Streptococcus moroccensis]|uniref:Aminopyrimidine aminohydrolase n=1 Tax=Streptococcus moroccensis TaxID=1451356 RepID=A0ABT9YUU1_9STRE|nr:TenA family protein [Streptococcus moroccensis]MDQ0223372.1 thiaminase [Streptococcus moroccensis]